MPAFDLPGFSRRSLLCLAAGAIGFGLNLPKIEIFGGAHLLIGNCFAMAVAIGLGPFWGLATALISVLPTVSSWNTGWGLLLYALEALAVGWASRRWNPLV